MKRRAFLTYLRKKGCILLREGKRHSVVYNSRTGRTSTVPRHTEISDILAEKICKDVGVVSIRKK